MNIVIIGHVCIDTNHSEHTSYTSAGGPGMFMAKVYKQFPGVSTQIISPYGADFLPYLKDIEIYPNTPLEEKTLHYRNKSHGNIRTQKAFNREYAGLPPITKELQYLVSQADIIFLAPLTPDYSAKYIHFLMQSAQKDTLKILLPQGYYRSFDGENNVHQREFNEADELMALFDIIIVSEEDHFVMREFARKWAQTIQVVITRGDKGAVYYHHGRVLEVPVNPVKQADIIDSVGSGDIFSAAFGYRYYGSKDIQKSLEFANDIARQCLFYKADSLKIILP